MNLKLLVVALMIAATPAAAQVGISAKADSQLVAQYDSARAHGFPDNDVSCVYGRQLADSSIVIDSTIDIAGDCPTEQLIGLMGFVPAEAVVGEHGQAWMERFARMLEQAPGSHIFGVIYGVGVDPVTNRRKAFAIADYQ